MNAWTNLKQIIRRRYEELKQIRDAPRAVAGGVAFGIFWGFTPLMGLKTLFSILFAWIFRCSKLSAAMAVTLHDILTPIWPIILRWEYDLGYWIVSHPHHFPEELHVKEAHLRYWLHWNTLELVWPTFVGSLLFAVPFALISYVLMKQTLERYEHMRHRIIKPPA